MVSRSKSAQGFRGLGSNTSFSAHRDTEVEYTLIKSLVEAYSQQCTPAASNKIPLRADKWTPVKEAGPSFRMDLSHVPMTSQWRPQPSVPQADNGDREFGRSISWLYQQQQQKQQHRRRYSSGVRRDHVAFSPRPRSYRPHSAIRNTFQRHSAKSEEKVLPVWSPDLKGGIVFSHQFPSTSSLAGTPKEDDIGNASPSRNPPVRNTRSASPRRAPPRQSRDDIQPTRAKSARQTQTMKAGQGPRPKTAGDSLRRPRYPAKTDFPPDTDIAGKRDPKGGESKEGGNGLDGGSTKLSQDERNILSLNVFLPREVGNTSVFCTRPQNASLTTTTTTTTTATKSAIAATEEMWKGSPQEGLPGFSTSCLVDRTTQTGESSDETSQERAGVFGKHGNTALNSLTSTCPRFRDVVGKRWEDDQTRQEENRKSNCKKSIHCELFGPVLCADCRLERERIVHTKALNPANDFSAEMLSLRGRNTSVVSP